MPTHDSKIRIYMRLYERLQVGDYPTKEKLIEALRDIGEDISERTLDRYRDNMFHEFGWKVRHSRARGGYELIAEQDSEDPAVIHEIFGQSIRANFLQNLLSRKNRKVVLFENRRDYPGIKFLPDLFITCQEQKEVVFRHKKFASDEIKEYRVQPVFLKEYQNRWYLVAWVPQKSDYRTFGLERIMELSKTDHHFDLPEGYEKEREVFKDMVGVNKENEKVETVRLKFQGIGVEYEKTLPQHHSGKIIEEGEDWAIFEYRVILNFEFIQRILAQADRLEVLEPESLAKALKVYLQRSFDKY